MCVHARRPYGAHLMTPDQAYTELLRRVREAGVLGSCASLLGWDERTYMPRGGSAHRGEQMALLAKLTHAMTTAPVIGELLAAAEGTDLTRDPASDAAVNVREIRRVYDRAVKLPQRLVEELARVSTRAQQVWQEARQANDFEAFRPFLEKIVELKREEAQAVGYKGVPYDALLDEYEPGADTTEITRVFAALRKDLAPLVQAIASSGRKAPRELLEGDYPLDRQQAFG